MSKYNNFFSSGQAAPVPARHALHKCEEPEEEPELVSVPEPSRLSSGRRSRAPTSESSSTPLSASEPNWTRPAAPQQAFTRTAASNGSPALSSTTRKLEAMQVNGEEPEIVSQPALGARARPRPPFDSPSAPAHAPGGPPPAQSNRPAVAPGRPGSKPGELLMEDVDIEDDSNGFSSGLGRARPAGPSSRVAVKGSPLPPDTLQQLRAVLWGKQGQPPATWKQGFFFNTTPGLQFGLVQKQGGPCGILAGVQAHILAALRQKSSQSFQLSPSWEQQQAALASALSEILWQARQGPSAQLALPGGQEAALGGSRALGYDQLAHAVLVQQLDSLEAVQSAVSRHLGCFMEEDGWGLVLFLFSLLLSRGLVAVAADMDEPSNALMGMHGYCTQELVNLILTGQAVSNVFDGNKQLDESTLLKGITKRCKLGLLTLFEWYKYVEVGSSLKNPSLPIWVVCSESHFTVLFSMDGKALQGSLPFDLYFYDQLANQDSPVKLTISMDPKGGWTGRFGDSLGDRGKCDGHNIPPLECVIETRWPRVAVSWNGVEPIL